MARIALHEHSSCLHIGSRIRSMVLASIDIGTNTVLLLIARIDNDGTIVPLLDEQRLPRLGEGVDASKHLSREAMHRVLAVLHDYRLLCAHHAAEKVLVVGTSAARDAYNRQEFAHLIQKEFGWELEVLSGNDEAYWTYRGALSGIDAIERATVVDIGGGSTEITVGTRRTILHTVSLDVGSVRLTERFLVADPPTPAQIEAAITAVEEELAKAQSFEFRHSTLVGVAGTVTSLAILAQGLEAFSFAAVANYRLPFERVDHLFKQLCGMSSEEIRQRSRVMEGRSDVITAGTLILREVMAHYDFKEIIVSERGVRYGIALREWERWKHEKEID